MNEKLINEVLNIQNITNIRIHRKNNTILVISYTKPDSEYTFKITENIYELAHKCKEWAWNKHKQVVSSMIDERTARSQMEKDQWYSSCTSYYEASLDGIYKDTEPEAIFKICEWIMEQKDKND